MKRFLYLLLAAALSCHGMAAWAQHGGHIVLSIEKNGLTDSEQELLRGVRSKLDSLFGAAGTTTDFRDNEEILQEDRLYESLNADMPTGGTPQTVFSDSLYVLSYARAGRAGRVHLKLTVKGRKVYNRDSYYDIPVDLALQPYLHELTALELASRDGLLASVPGGEKRLTDLRERLKGKRRDTVAQYNRLSFLPFVTAAHAKEYGAAVLSAAPLAGALASSAGIAFEASQVKRAGRLIGDAASDSERDHYVLEKSRHSRRMGYWIGGEAVSLALYGAGIWYSFHRREDRLRREGALSFAPSYVPGGAGLAMVYTF